MKLPQLFQASAQTLTCTQFLGLNYTPEAAENEFSDEENLSFDAFPLLAPRAGRHIVHTLTAPQGMIGHEKLFFIDDGDIYYGGVQMDFPPLSAGEKTLARIGAYIAIFPDKLLFHTETLTLEAMENRVETASSVTATLCADASGGAFSAPPDASDTAPQEPEDGALWIDTSSSPHTLKRWSAQSGMWIAAAQTFVKLACASIGKGFSVMDGVHIEGMGALDGDYWLEGCGDDFLVVTALIDAPFESEGSVTVVRETPQMDFVLELDNRLWGCSSADHAIYACKLGDPKNWNCFMGLSSDSYAMTVGSPGPFTGCVAHLGSVLFFKSDCILRIYGTKPANFQLSTVHARGVSPGSAKSCAVLNETLYYLSAEGVLCCDGGVPVPFSRALSPLRLKNGCGASYMGRYYLSAEDQNGDTHLFFYDEALGFWRRQDDTHARFACVCDDLLYCIDQDGVLWCEGGQSPYTFPDSHAEAPVPWRALTPWLDLRDPYYKHVRRIVVRAQLFAGSTLCVRVRYDGDAQFTTAAQFSAAQFSSVSVPIRPRRADRMRLEFSGTGQARIQSLSRVCESGTELGGRA